jgi:hypothetical protein
VKEVIILRGFNHIGRGSFPNPFYCGVKQRLQRGVRCVGGHKTEEQHTSDLILLISIGGGVSCHQVMSSTFEFMHNCCHKSLNEACRGGRVYVLKSSSPSCCGFLHLFPMSMFGIANFYQGVGKFVRLCGFGLHHRANISHVMISCKFVHSVQ